MNEIELNRWSRCGVNGYAAPYYARGRLLLRPPRRALASELTTEPHEAPRDRGDRGHTGIRCGTCRVVDVSIAAEEARCELRTLKSYHMLG